MSTARILDVFEPLRRHRLRQRGRLRETFEPELTDLQSKILELLGIKKTAFRAVV